jgi:hypothetical protein
VAERQPSRDSGMADQRRPFLGHAFLLPVVKSTVTSGSQTT